MEHHIFSVDIAIEVGVNSAVIFNHLYFWIDYHRKNKENFYDGRYWTYTSQRALEEHFPYLTTDQIRTAIKKLKEKNLVLTGNYNKVAYDRTTWYALSDYAESILQRTRFHLGELPNPFGKNPEPIPYVDSNIETNTDSNKESICISNDIQYTKEKIPYSEIIDYLNAKTGQHYRANTNETQSFIRARFREKFTLDDFKKVIDTKCAEWMGTDWEKYLRPKTLFGTKFESYLNQKPTTSFKDSPQFNPNTLRRDNGVPLDELFV